MNKGNSPYACHIFICVNDRRGARKSCADGGSVKLKDYFKEQVGKRGLKPRVRVSHSGCMGLCEKGPNVMLYPQGLWFSGVGEADAEHILDIVQELIST